MYKRQGTDCLLCRFAEDSIWRQLGDQRIVVGDCIELFLDLQDIRSYRADRDVYKRQQLTHTFNAMPPFTHRAPGPIGAAADDDHCMAELICDGIHIHPAVVRTTFKIFGDDRIILISDSMRATGMEDGEYDLGGQKVIVRGNLATLEDGTIAGSRCV